MDKETKAAYEKLKGTYRVNVRHGTDNWETTAAETVEAVQKLNEDLKSKAGPQNSFEMVKEFHEAFGHPVAESVTIPADNRLALRLSLILEEAVELAEGMGFLTGGMEREIEKMLEYGPELGSDIVEIADALGDLEYVTNGAALEMGVNLPVVVREIHRSNMTKLGPDGQPIYREDGKILKGEGYEEPDLITVLGL